MFPDKTTNWTNQNGLNRTVSYVCYWIDKYMSDETGKQAGNSWIDTASKWKDQQVTSLNRVFAISN